MFYTKTDEDGFPVAFWMASAYADPASVIPSDAVEITQEQHAELYEFQGFRKFVDGEVVVYEPPAPPPHFPDLTARQFRLGLLASGLLNQVDDAIAALPEPDRSAAQIEWEYATTFSRSHSLVNAVSAQLGLSPEDVDALWLAAVEL